MLVKKNSKKEKKRANFKKEMKHKLKQVDKIIVNRLFFFSFVFF
tara:strand:- start:116 stop:247 length:132 start_codon:yes stop_codon:yes gene_type:complete